MMHATIFPKPHLLSMTEFHLSCLSVAMGLVSAVEIVGSCHMLYLQ